MTEADLVLDAEYVHKEYKLDTYIFIHRCKIKFPDGWKEGIIYYNKTTLGTYVRTTENFCERFEPAS